jgi:hypothetical protein
MFTKKFVTALLLTPLFVGCVVEGDGDTDADTDPGTSSVSATGDTGVSSVSATGDTGVSSVSATGDTGVSSVSATGETGLDETAGATTGGGGDGMFCLPTCEEAIDCCAPGTKAIGCPTDYPVHYECVEGICEYQGCAADGDCAAVAGTTCHDVNEFGTCVPVCTVETEDVDCLVDMGETCTGMTDDGELYCIVEPVDCTDKTCGDFACNPDTGTCECDGDDDCADLGGTCNLETGACNCTDDASCGEGFSCVAF